MNPGNYISLKRRFTNFFFFFIKKKVLVTDKNAILFFDLRESLFTSKSNMIKYKII